MTLMITFASVPDAPSTVPAPSRARTVALGGLLIALLAIGATITIPLGPVPFTLQTAVVVLIALLLSPREAALVMGGYLLVGAAGAPVFSANQGGFGVLLGPTGGFLWGFLIGATLGSWVRIALTRSGASASRRLAADVIAAVIVLLVCYFFGVIQLKAVLDLTFLQALLAGVVPFVWLDAAKAAGAIAIAAVVRPVVSR